MPFCFMSSELIIILLHNNSRPQGESNSSRIWNFSASTIFSWSFTHQVIFSQASEHFFTRKKTKQKKTKHSVTKNKLKLLSNISWHENLKSFMIQAWITFFIIDRRNAYMFRDHILIDRQKYLKFIISEIKLYFKIRHYFSINKKYIKNKLNK